MTIQADGMEQEEKSKVAAAAAIASAIPTLLLVGKLRMRKKFPKGLFLKNGS